MGPRYEKNKVIPHSVVCPSFYDENSMNKKSKNDINASYRSISQNPKENSLKRRKTSKVFKNMSSSTFGHKTLHNQGNYGFQEKNTFVKTGSVLKSFNHQNSIPINTPEQKEEGE